MSAGYVYALINPTLPGLVKVGRTAKDPEQRARELSTATGVASAFIVAYKKFFNDCIAAEAKIHLILESKGWRFATNREFFEAPLDVVVEAVSSLPDVAAVSATDADNGTDTPPDAVALSQQLHAEALKCLHGDTLTFPNETRALELLKKSSKLGNPAADLTLGKILIRGNSAAPKDINAALACFDKAMVWDHPEHYALSCASLADGGYNKEAQKCWAKFIDSIEKRFNEIMMDITHIRAYEKTLMEFELLEKQLQFSDFPLLSASNPNFLNDIGTITKFHSALDAAGYGGEDTDTLWNGMGLRVMRIDLMQGNYTETAQSFEQSLYCKGLIHKNNGQLAEAIELLKNAAEAENNPLAWVRLGQIADDQNFSYFDPAQAKEYYHYAVDAGAWYSRPLLIKMLLSSATAHGADVQGVFINACEHASQYVTDLMKYYGDFNEYMTAALGGVMYVKNRGERFDDHDAQLIPCIKKNLDISLQQKFSLLIFLMFEGSFREVIPFNEMEAFFSNIKEHLETERDIYTLHVDSLNEKISADIMGIIEVNAALIERLEKLAIADATSYY